MIILPILLCLTKAQTNSGYRGSYGQMLKVDGIFGEITLAMVNRYKDQYLPGGNTGDLRGVIGNTTW